MPLQKQTVDVPFVFGQDQGTAPEILQPGTPTVVTNGQYAKNGRVNKRDGTVAIVTSGASVMNRLAVDGDMLLGFQDVTGGALGERIEATNAWQVNEFATPWTVRRRPVFRDMSQTLQQVDVAIVGNYRCAVWRKVDDNRIHLLITETASGTVVFNADVSAADAQGPRIAKALGAEIAIVSWVYAAGVDVNVLKVIKIDATVDPPTVGAEVAIVADVSVAVTPGIQYDITGMTGAGGRWACSYRQNATDDLAIQEITSAPAAGLSAVIAATITVSAPLQVAGNLFVPYFDFGAGELRYVIRDATTWLAVLGVTLIQAATSVQSVGLTNHVNGADAIVVWSRTTAGSGSMTLRWAVTTVAGAVTVRQPTYRLDAESKPYTLLGTYWCWVRQGDFGSAAYALVELPNVAGLLARPVATAGIGQTPVGRTTNLRWTSREVAGTYHTAVPAALATAGTRTGADELEWTISDPARWQSATFGSTTYFSGGIVCSWDGVRLTENAVVQSPQLISITPSGVAGGLESLKTYSWVVIYEYIDERGQRMRSVRSQILTGSPGGLLTSMDLVISPLTLTLRQQTTTPLSRVVIRIYRTEGDSTGAEVAFHAIHSIDLIPAALDNDPFAAGDITFNDGVPDATILGNEVLYTVGGALDNDTPWGGATYLWRHGPRLYACGGEDPEIVWASKEEVAGEPAQFSLGLQSRVAGDEIIGGASLDGLNVLFSEEAIYGISGDGPNDTGNPQTGTFSIPEPIASDAGCITARSIIDTPAGIMFQSRRGIMLLDRSRNIKYVGKPVEDTLRTFPLVIWSCLLPRTGHVFFGVAGVEAQRVLAYDYVYDRWSERTYPASWGLSDGIVYQERLTILRSNGRVYQETPGTFTDDTAWFGQVLETGWISYGSQQGYKRLWRTILLTERRSAHGLTVEFAYDYGAYEPADTVTLTAAETLAAGDQIRIHMKHQKGEAWRFRISETNPGAGAGEGFVAIGLGFEVGLMPGVQRLPAIATR